MNQSMHTEIATANQPLLVDGNDVAALARSIAGAANDVVGGTVTELDSRGLKSVSNQLC
ncbi:hypothetical protein CERZMDRAFT_90337 [Cercospora zeae-maydis SCOH1-5]|uniref:Uncharacterized protein n=1 Tax=Cercospora zeae-maydis SCOH1-5 TaxID=717836 RepID=A0A6A6FLW3_9PEZI|nr:hypothetical protein CERZMDRAFT_90337 [Cercospora zeae-maydis SCOH1-5]